MAYINYIIFAWSKFDNPNGTSTDFHELICIERIRRACCYTCGFYIVVTLPPWYDDCPHGSLTTFARWTYTTAWVMRQNQDTSAVPVRLVQQLRISLNQNVNITHHVLTEMSFGAVHSNMCQMHVVFFFCWYLTCIYVMLLNKIQYFETSKVDKLLKEWLA